MLEGVSPAEIIEALKALGVTHERIAATLGRDRTAATKMLSGVRSIKAHELAPLTALVEAVRAEALQAKPGHYLHFSKEFEVQSEPPKLARPFDPNGMNISEIVQAGVWLEEGIDQTEPERYPAAPDPRYPREFQWLARVRGDSMNALLKNGQPAGILSGDLVHLVDAIAMNYDPAHGDVVEVERLRYDGREREVTLKQIELTSRGRIILWPRSTNPRWQEPIEYREGDPKITEVRVRAKMLQHIRTWS